MRKRTLLSVILIVCLALTALTVAACNKEEVGVTFMISDSDIYTTVQLKRGSSIGGLPVSPKRTGYDFEGWYLDNGSWTQPFTGDTKVVDNISVYAHWVEAKAPAASEVRVIFDSRGGSVVADIVLKSGETLTLPEAPKRAGFVFSGWYRDLYFTPGEEFTGGVVQSDMTLYAYWLPLADENYYTVSGGIITGLTDAGKELTKVALPSSLNGAAISGVGDSVFEGNTNITEVSFPVGYTSIGERAFKDCTSLKRITFVDSVKAIGKSAFENCSSLTKIQLPASVSEIPESCFSGCKAIRSITFGINSSVEKIAKKAFYDLRALEKIGIPDSVTEIGDEAYKNCIKATSLTFGSGIRAIGKDAFSSCKSLTAVAVPDTVTSLGEGAFRGVSKAKNISLGIGITAVPANAFNGSSDCESLTIKGKVTEIGEFAFSGMEYITEVSLPDTLTTLGVSAFSGALRLTNINLADTSVTELPDSIFLNAKSLQSIDISKITKIGQSAFSGSGLTKIVLKNVTELGGRAFENCEKLSEVSFGSGLSSIPAYCFKGDVKLTSVVLESITKIGTEAFANCSYILKEPSSSASEDQTSPRYGGLAEVTLGDSLTEIGDKAFSNCRALKKLEIPQSVEVIGKNVFTNTPVENAVTTTGVNYTYTISYVGDWAVAFSFGKNETQTLTGEEESVLPFEIELKAGTRGISRYLFTGNSAITAVRLPLTLSYMGVSAFGECKNLSEVTFYGEAGGNIEIAEGAFKDCTSLSSFTIPENVDFIGKSAFSGCKLLTGIVIPESVTAIGDYAFENCEKLTSLTMSGSNLASIGKSAFKGAFSDAEDDAEALKITIPSSVKSIGDSAFDGISALKEVSFSDNSVLESIGAYAFFGTGITSIVLPASLNVLGEYAFAGCKNLKNVTFTEPSSDDAAEDKLTAIPEGAFSESGITEIVIPESVTEIGYGAFKECMSLEKVELTGNALCSIGQRAFYGSKNLQFLYAEAYTEEEWEKVEKGGGWKSGTPSSFTVKLKAEEGEDSGSGSETGDNV